jgi:2-polyprenyl-6-methoxyphenol hydroxylase-like FAD-dependent oxidoreductase
MRGRSFDLAVLGGGPAGMMAALCAARDSDVALVVDRIPQGDEFRRIDTVPARVLALLVDFGVDPRELGVDRLYEERLVAWSTATPQLFHLSPAAHLERPLLDRVLFSRVSCHPRIALFVSRAWARDDGMFWGDGWRARRLADATGRAAATADSVVRAERPWAARTLWQTYDPDGRGPGFGIAALPDGYAYRVEARRRVVVGFVGRGHGVEGTPAELAWRLRASGGGWLIADLPPVATFDEGRASTASVQWATPSMLNDGPRAVRIGDAALARDPMSAQGIGIACSEALFVSAIARAADLAMFEARQTEQRHVHLKALEAMIAGCLFSNEPTWRDYAAFVAAHAQGAPSDPPVALRDGKVVRLPGSHVAP